MSCIKNINIISEKSLPHKGQMQEYANMGKEAYLKKTP